MWFDNECTCLRKDLRQLSNKKHKEPANQTLRLAYSDCLKNYKKLICNKRDQYYEAKIDEIDESIDQNNFWNLFKNLKAQIKAISPAAQSGGLTLKPFTNNLNQNSTSPKLTQREN